MIRVVNFEAQDLEDVLRGGGDFFCGSSLLKTPHYGEILKAAGPAWSAFDINEQIVGCGGLSEDHPGCVTGWTLLDPVRSGPHMLALTREARKQFAACKVHRIQAHVDPNFPPAVRWIKLLDFQYEGLMRKWSPDGRDMALWAMVK